MYFCQFCSQPQTQNLSESRKSLSFPTLEWSELWLCYSSLNTASLCLPQSFHTCWLLFLQCSFRGLCLSSSSALKFLLQHLFKSLLTSLSKIQPSCMPVPSFMVPLSRSVFPYSTHHNLKLYHVLNFPHNNINSTKAGILFVFSTTVFSG